MYNAKNAKEVTGELPKDTIFDAVIIDIKDGKVKEFIPESAKDTWKGDINGTAINITAEIIHEEKKVHCSQMLTYNENDGVTEFNASSNMAKYNKKYSKLPEVGDQIKIMTNDKGFGRFKIE